jgi:hypothetical protein
MTPRLFRTTPAAIVLLISAAPVFAAEPGCAVYNDSQLLWMPPGRFDEEINRLRPADFRVPPAVQRPDDKGLSPFDASTKVDLEELGMALDDLKVGPERKADLVERYAAVRTEIGRRMKQQERHPEYDIPYPVPAGIPEEFSDYLQALLWSHNGQVDDARVLWEKIAALPADSRKYRGPWAVFMLGRSWVSVNPNRAIAYFRQTREWIGDGPDRLGLASSSLGWEGRALLNQDHAVAAARVYAEQMWTGDPTAETSLQICLKTLLDADDATRRATLADPLVRQAMTAFVFCDIGHFIENHRFSDEDFKQFDAWLSDVQTHGLTDADEIDRLGWALYRKDGIAATRPWIARGNANSPLHRLLWSKVQLSDGDVDGAIRQLESAVQQHAPSLAESGVGLARPDLVTSTATADLAAVCLARGRYTDALRTCCKSDDRSNWEFAAYIAERVLTTDELRTFVGHLADADATPGNRQAIRNLLARRLCRDGQIDDALPLFNPTLSAKMKQYQRLLSEGRDKSLPEKKRAASLMAAAGICNADGAALFGIETGTTDNLPTANRLLNSGTTAPGFTPGMTAATEDERNRVLATKPSDEQRFGYFKNKAADIAWDAAALLPDNSAEKLDALYTAGTWLKVHDPKAADRFYKAICKHCGATDLGRRCAAQGWFAPRIGK